MQSIWLLSLLIFFFKVNAGAAACPFNQNPLPDSGNVISGIGSGYIDNVTSPYVFETYADGANPDFNVTLFEKDGNDPTAAFAASWSKSAFLVRVGLHMDEGKKYTEYKNVKAEYAYTRIPYNCIQTAVGEPCDDGGVGGDYSYIGVYGWFKNPLVEYYVVDDWLGNAWGDDKTNVGRYTVCLDGDCTVGSITVDGAEYTVFKNTRTGTTITGEDSTFDQYFSVRATPRQCGTIPLTQHFKEFESLGLPMGDLYEAKLITQTGGGIGWINYTYGIVEANINDDCVPQSDDHYVRVGAVCELRPCASRRKNTLDLSLPCGSNDCYWDTQADNATACIGQGTACTNSDQYEQKENSRSCGLKACASRKKNSVNPDLPCGSSDCYWDTQAADTTTCIGPSAACTNSEQYVQRSDSGSCVLKACTDRKKNSVDSSLPCGSTDCYWDTEAADTTTCTPCTDTDKYEKKEDGHTCVLKETSASSITAAQTAVLLLTVFWLIFSL